MTGPLIATADLAGRLEEKDLAVLDTSWFMPGEPGDAKAAYRAAHIPGAVFFDIDTIADPTGGLPHMLPDSKAFTAAARALGVQNEGDVVVYDRRGLFSAPRVWWSFRAMGHDRIYVLDGGLPKWTRERRPVESGWRAPPPGNFQARPRQEFVHDLKEVWRILESGGKQIVDARSADRFSGRAAEPRAGLRLGHMPGAFNVPWTGLITASGELKSPETIRTKFAEAKVDVSRPVVTTCGSGVSAAILALALARIGAAEAAVYDGSWAEWGARADTPVATGDGG